MCGIAGIVSSNQDVSQQLLKAQTIQQHRGPDAYGSCQHQIYQWNIGLAHQRLAILDLTDAGKQPMYSETGDGWIVYNGEIYNYLEIRDELKKLGHQFRGESDTEVVIASLEQWGIEEALSKFNGMWAFAWVDRKQQRLILSRDRLGIKPLYFCLAGDDLYFASEIKTILELSPTKFNLNYQIIGEYLIQSLLETSNETFFQGIEQVPPASYAVVDLNADFIHLEFKSYWTLANQQAKKISESNLIDKIQELFFDAVRLRLRSDVPVGVLLSGGVDSSSIAAAMQKILGTDANLNLLSAVSQDPKYDESPFIDVMAKHLNLHVQKVELNLEATNAFNYLEQVCWFNDEPVGSFSTVAHYLLMQKARELGITVILSGQGGDELLCGYKKYIGFYLQNLLRQGKFLNAAQVISSFAKQGSILNQFNLGEAKRYLPSYLKGQDLDIRGEVLRNFFLQEIGLSPGMTVEQRQVVDVQKLSVPALLHYEDRMSMAWAREIRVPFLDYRLVELLVSLPTQLKLQQGWTKFIFRQAMEPYLPKDIVWRKDKQGFVNPQSEWLKHELKPGVLNYFGEESLIVNKGMIDRNNLLAKYELFCQQGKQGGNIWFKEIFNPLCLEIWLRKFANYIA